MTTSSCIYRSEQHDQVLGIAFGLVSLHLRLIAVKHGALWSWTKSMERDKKLGKCRIQIERAGVLTGITL